MHAHWTLRSGFEHTYVDVMYYILFTVNLQVVFLELPKLFTPYGKATSLDARQSVSAFSMNKMRTNFLPGFCFLSSPSDVLLLRILHGSSRLNHARALKNLIRRPFFSKRGREKRLLPCVCSAFYCANVK